MSTMYYIYHLKTTISLLWLINKWPSFCCSTTTKDSVNKQKHNELVPKHNTFPLSDTFRSLERKAHESEFLCITLKNAMDNVLQSGRRMSLVASSPLRLELLSWLVQFYASLFSKFSLYFFEVFIREAPLTEVRTTMLKASIDYYAKYGFTHFTPVY